MHLSFVRIPAPATAAVDRDILERIKCEARKNSVALASLSILHLAVPEMINRAPHPARGAADRFVEGPGPAQISRPLAVVHIVHMHHCVVRAVNGGGHGSV